MRFTKTLCFAVTLCTLNACSNLNSIVPKVGGAKSETSETQTAEASSAAEINGDSSDQPGEAAAAKPVATVNPYLANPKPVPVDIEQLFKRALKLHRLQDWSEAELAWEELTLVAPELSGPYLNLGIVFEATDRPEEAARAYQAAIDANPLNVDAYNQLAILKRKSGEFSEAEQLYTQALQVWPDHPASHRNIAILYDLYMGKLEQALDHYQQYESLLDEPDRSLEGWIADLRRRIDS